MHWNVSIGPEKWPIFGRFPTLFPLKRPVRRPKNTSNMAVKIGNVIDDVTCKSSIPFPLCSGRPSVDSILVCMVLERTQALFWAVEKIKRLPPPLICEIKRIITNFVFMWPKG
jgi:hypothetical protein